MHLTMHTVRPRRMPRRRRSLEAAINAVQMFPDQRNCLTHRRCSCPDQPYLSAAGAAWRRPSTPWRMQCLVFTDAMCLDNAAGAAWRRPSMPWRRCSIRRSTRRASADRCSSPTTVGCKSLQVCSLLTPAHCVSQSHSLLHLLASSEITTSLHSGRRSRDGWGNGLLGCDAS